MTNKIKFNKNVKRVIIFILVLCIIHPMMTFKVDAASTKETVKVGCFPLNGFYNISDKGTVSGYGADYTSELFAHAGMDYEYVKYKSWVDALDALSNNEIDILAPAQHTPERDAKYIFDAFPIGTEYGALMTLNTNDSLVYEDYNEFNSLNVGVVETLVFLDDFKQYESLHDFSVNLHYYKDTPALINALNSGEVDAILGNMMIKTGSMKLLARFGSSPIYYMLSPNASYLEEDINHTIDNMTSGHPELQNTLASAYFSDFEKLPFSKQELDFIAQNGTINVACADNYPPFSYVNSNTGKIDGVDRKIMDKISKISGIKFEYIPIPFDSDTSAFIKDHKISLMSGVENDKHTILHDSTFSEKYLSITKYFYGKEGSTLDIDTHKKIAVVSSSESQITTWHNRYPKFDIIRYSSIDASVDALHEGNVDFILEDSYSMERVLASSHNQDIVLIPTQGIESNICFKIQLTEANANILSSILNKSIKYISQNDIETTINDYVQKNHYKYGFSDFIYQYRFQLIAALAVLIIIGLAFGSYYHIKRKAQLVIEENEMKLRHITNNIRGGVIVLKENQGMNITFANDGFLQLIGTTREEFEENKEGSYLAYVHKEDLEKLQEAVDSDMNELTMELRIMKTNGDYVPALFNCSTGRKINGDKELYCVIIDMTEQNRLLEELRIDKSRTELILSTVEEIFYEVNCDTYEISTSPSFMNKFGWTLPDRYEHNDNEFEEMWHTKEGEADTLRLNTLQMLQDKKTSTTQIKLKCNSDSAQKEIWCEIVQYPILNKNGAVVTVIGIVRDINEQVKERERLIKQAQTDTLTGLYNKETFGYIVSDMLKESSSQNHALIFVDLDRFKNLNDTIGHLTGDHAICEASDKLSTLFSGSGIISRFGGDEFCIFVKNISYDVLYAKMDHLVDKLRASYHGEKGDVHITCSCGVACTTVAGYDYEKLMTCADQALYHSKDTGRDRYTFYKDIEHTQE